MCAKPIALPAAIQPLAPRGLFQRFKDAGRAMLDKRKLKDLVLEAVADGVLTDNEWSQIEAVLSEKGIDRRAITDWSEEILERAVNAIDRTNVSTARVTLVDGIIRTLGVSSAKQMDRLNRWRYIAGIREGALPIQSLENTVLRKNEQVHWVEPAKLWEERVVSRRYEGGSSGISFRIAKGVTIRTGSTRGQLVTDTADVPVCDGLFIITSDRLIFQGASKSFETKYEKILGINNHLAGIRYSETNRQKPRKIQYYSSNGDIIVEILSVVFSRASAGR